MRTSLERLLAEAVDFDARAMPLSDSVPAYAALRRGPVRNLIGRFCCSAAQLPELITIGGPDFDADLAVSASKVATDRASWEWTLTQDVASLNQFLKAFPNLDIGSYEIQIPDTVDLTSWISDLNGFRDVDLFVEVPVDGDLEAAIAFFAETEWVGGKLSEGNPERMGRFISNCVDLDVPFKLGRVTAESGFLAILSGATLCRANDWSPKELTRVLEDPDAQSMTFKENSVLWRSYEASLDEIDEVRSIFRSIETPNPRLFTDHITQLGHARWSA